MIRADVSPDARCAYLIDSEEKKWEFVLKAYVSADGRHLRIVLPELENFAQARIRLDDHMIDFERDPAAAQKGVRR